MTALASSLREFVAPATSSHGAPSDALAQARALAPLIEAEADLTEQGTQMTERVVQAFRDSRLFWMNVPTELNGGGLDLHQRLDVIEELARADGSTGWAFMAIAGYVGYTAIGCGDDAVRDLYGDPDNLQLVAGMANPVGTAERVAGGYNIEGQYRFGSGTPHADWVAAGTFIKDGNGAQICGFVPAKDVQFQGNWDVLGLAGTGSVDYYVPKQFVPDAYTFDASNLVPLRGTASDRMDFFSIAMLYHAGIALGLGKRGLEEIVKIADSRKTRPNAAPIGEQQLFLHDFGLHEAGLVSSRALLTDVIEDGLRIVARGDQLTDFEKGRFRQSCTFIHKMAMNAIEFAYFWGGSVPLRRPHPLGRVMLDMHALNQHLLVDHNNLVTTAPAIMEKYRAG